jgi:glycosyltransferase involved in cell wall biosynthesis
VSTDCGGGGARALIDHGEDGLIVPCDDVNALAEAIRQSLADPVAAKSRGKKAAEKAKNFSPAPIVALWEAYIQKIVGRPPAGR